VEVEDTDVLEAEPANASSGASTLSSEGARRLLGLLEACMARAAKACMARAASDAIVDAGEGSAR
jgi:hypothetical protein